MRKGKRWKERRNGGGKGGREGKREVLEGGNTGEVEEGREGEREGVREVEKDGRGEKRSVVIGATYNGRKHVCILTNSCP